VIVVDASAALQAAASRAGLEPLAELEPVAPPLMWSEAFSALHEAHWRGAATRELTDAARSRLLAGPIARRQPARLHLEAWSVADLLGWARTYDAEYVALARLLRCPLLTIDERLRRGAGRIVEIVGPSDL
jgi:predicted nucleic acid-binding protein